MIKIDFKNFDYKRLMKFEHNIGAKDKKIRLFVGAGLLLGSLFLGSIVLLLLGGILVATGYFGWCPAYSGFGCNSFCPNEPASAAPESGSDNEGH